VPDQRKKGKKQVSVWLTEEERDALRLLAEVAGTTMGEILKEKIHETLEAKKQRSQAGSAMP